jgi:nucleoside-diphosphate-sugar epimerase
VQDLCSTYSIHSVDICWFNDSLDYNETKDYRNLTRQELSKFDAVILLAGHSSVKMCDGPVTSSWTNNVNNFVSLVNKLDKSQTLIYASSGSVYGSQNTITIEDVDLTFKPINNYDLTKYSLDIQAQKFINDGYKIIGLRFGTVNGYSPNLREELMINSMIKKSLFDGNITVNNKHIKRPILGIGDISRAVDSILRNPTSGIYNLASFVSTVDVISNSISKSLYSKILERPNVAGAYDFTMDTGKFRRIYNFTFSENLDTIVKELVDSLDKVNFTNRNQFINYE